METSQGWIPDATNVCVKIFGDAQFGESCTTNFGPDEEWLDECGPGLVCGLWGGMGGFHGSCQDFCGPGEPTCDDGMLCVSEWEALPWCRVPCDPDDLEACADYPGTYCEEGTNNPGIYICTPIPVP